MNRYQRPMRPYATLAEWARQVELPSSGIRLHTYDTGANAKTPVVFIHGLGDEADTWRHVIPQISPVYRSIAPDLPGFGRSETVKGRYSIPFFARTLLELMENQSIPHAVLVGHSMGAVIAHWIALHHPDRVKRLILIGGSLVSKENRLTMGLLLFLVPGLGEWLYTRLRKDPRAAYSTLEPYYNNLDALPQAEQDFLYQRVNERVWSEGQRRAFFSALRSLAGWISPQQKGLPVRLRHFAIPTSVIWGENDQIQPVENAHALIDMLPSAELIIVPGAGHNVHQERADVVVEVIDQRLPRQTTGPGG